jgi:hypothetical protein
MVEIGLGGWMVKGPIAQPPIAVFDDGRDANLQPWAPSCGGHSFKSWFTSSFNEFSPHIGGQRAAQRHGQLLGWAIRLMLRK